MEHIVNKIHKSEMDMQVLHVFVKKIKDGKAC